MYLMAQRWTDGQAALKPSFPPSAHKGRSGTERVRAESQLLMSVISSWQPKHH